MDEKVQIAFGVWAGVSLLGYVLFYANKNTQFKRKYYPAFSVVTGVLFLFIVNLMGFFKHQFWIVIVPIVALITFMNIRGAKFCDNCGKSNCTQSLKDKKIECQKCGHTI
ncbi:hypothetical protein KY890_002957 [Vibrio vulnificus]|nr:hypothetical protein [Vibrio vulnificus]EHW0638360.1 hypothetical protein [Vibrio vulnificus]EIZ1459056.1 hypothetical protein [Vibrio vulnificus]